LVSRQDLILVLRGSRICVQVLTIAALRLIDLSIGIEASTSAHPLLLCAEITTRARSLTSDPRCLSIDMDPRQHSWLRAGPLKILAHLAPPSIYAAGLIAVDKETIRLLLSRDITEPVSALISFTVAVIIQTVTALLLHIKARLGTTPREV